MGGWWKTKNAMTPTAAMRTRRAILRKLGFHGFRRTREVERAAAEGKRQSRFG
jgi:hypothetical protein